MRIKEFFNYREKHATLLIILTVITIFFTHPFLKYPFDVYFHLNKISLEYNVDVIPKGKILWHYLWAKLFYLFNIDNTQIFIRAKIIHITQILITFFSVFFLSNVIIRNLFVNIENIQVKYLAYWSTIIWFTIFATSSVGQHQVWILWYSINYQITLPLVLLITGLTLSIIFESLSFRKNIFYAVYIFTISFFILTIHAAEFLYFLMYLGVLLIVSIDKIFLVFKRYPYYAFFSSIISIIAITVFLDFIKSFSYREPLLLKYMSFEKLPELLYKINSDGAFIISRLNRAFASINELINLSIFLMIIIILIFFYRRYKKYTPLLHLRMFVFIVITSLFILIPVIQFTAGLAGLVTYPQLAHRLYYSSLLFVLVPSASFYVLSLLQKRNLLIVNLTIITLLLGTFIYSKYDIGHNQNYYKNIISIKNSFSERKMGFNLSPQNIMIIGKELKKYENNANSTDLYFYAREDIAFILKKIYNKNVYFPNLRKGKRLDVEKYMLEYKKDKTHKNIILFTVPKGFPDYEPYK